MESIPNEHARQEPITVRLDIAESAGVPTLSSVDTRFTLDHIDARAISNPVGLTCTTSLDQRDGAILVTAAITNDRSTDIDVDRVVLIDSNVTVGLDPRRHSVYRNGHQSWSGTRTFRSGEADRDMATPLLRRTTTDPKHRAPAQAGRIRSDIFTTISEVESGDSLAVGFLDGSACFGYVEVDHTGDGRTRLRAWADLDGITLEPGRTLNVGPVHIEARSGRGSARAATESFMAEMGDHSSARNSGTHPGGWCSWYYYFQKVTESDVRDNLTALVDLRDRGSGLPCDYVMIDDGHQRAIGDWLDTDDSFPSGMARLASDIRAGGFDAGIWLAPFLVGANSNVAKQHPEWILRNSRGHRVTALINPAWGPRPIWALDTTNPEVLEHLERVSATIASSWGYSILKLDFLFAGSLVGERQGDVTRARALRMGLDAIRRGAGEDSFLLACGCPLGPAVGVADAMRIGADVAPYWTNRVARVAQRDMHGLSTRHAIRNTLTRSMMDGLWWANDPDCLMVREDRTRLSLEEVHTLCTVIGMSNGMLVISDNLAVLARGRRELVNTTSGLRGGRLEVIDLFDRDIPEVLVSRHDDWVDVAVLNMDDVERHRRLDLSRIDGIGALGMDAQDLWTGRDVPIQGGIADFGMLPAHGCALVRIAGDARTR